MRTMPRFFGPWHSPWGRSSIQTNLFFDALEETIYELLRSVKDVDGSTITIRVFDGLSFTAEKLPDAYKVDNFTGKTKLRKGYVKPKAKLSRRYTENLNIGIKQKPLKPVQQGGKRWSLHDDDEDQ